ANGVQALAQQGVDDAASAAALAAIADGKAVAAQNTADSAAAAAAVAQGDVDSLALSLAVESLQWLGTPVGVELPFHPNAPLPPTNDPRFRYVILTAGLAGSGGYNEGVLTDETVTGSDPTITATAVVSLAGSPMDGETIDLINTSRVFLRPGPASGPIVDSQNKSHFHQISYGENPLSSGSGGASNSVLSGTTLVKNSTASGGDEARPRYIP